MAPASTSRTDTRQIVGQDRAQPGSRCRFRGIADLPVAARTLGSLTLTRVRYLWPLPGIVMDPIMVGLGIHFLVDARYALGSWVGGLGAIVVGAIIWALFQPGGWWRPNTSYREYWEDPDRWQDPDSN
jgi:hypothetical protein